MDFRETGWEGLIGLNSYSSLQGSVGCFCENDNEPSDSIKAGEFID
jgi:hypothetical protein